MEFQNPDLIYLEGIKTREAFEFLSELYFKFALIADDKRDSQTALEFYNKCINI